MFNREARSSSRRKKELEKQSTKSKHTDIRDLLTKSKEEVVSASREESKMASNEQEQVTMSIELQPSLMLLSRKLDQVLTRITQVESSMSNMQSTITSQISSVTSRVVQVEKRAQSIEGRQHNTENELRGIRLENGEIRKQLDTATLTIKKLEETVDDLQGRVRRNTLVFKGIPEKMEGASSGWDRVEKMIMKILVENLKMNVDWIHIERAHRSPTHLSASQQQQNYPKPRPRPIYVAFSTWKAARAVLSNAKMLKENPLTCEEDGVTNIVSIYIEQMYSPIITRKRSEMLRKRWQLKQQHPDWEVFLVYPAKLLRRTADGNIEQIPASVLRACTE